MKSKHVIIPIFVSHQGCPNDCVFCNQKKITGYHGGFDLRYHEDMIDEYLDSIKEPENTVIEIAFYGGSFTGIDEELQIKYLELAHRYLTEGKISGIRLSTRPDYIDDRKLTLLKKYGVTTIELGVQSFDENVLKVSNRGHDKDCVETSANLIKKYGFILGVQLMVGLPGDNYVTAIESAKRLVELKPDIARIYPTLVIRETELESMLNVGSYKPLSLEEAIEISKDMYKIISAAGINVIRIGLQPTENILEGNDVVTGPFHPSFRHLVESRLLRERLEELLSDLNTDKKVLKVKISNKKVSELVGIKKENIVFLKNKYGFKDIKIIQNDNVSDDIEIEFEDSL